MFNLYEYLIDDKFLKKIDTLNIKQQYAKITVVNWDEKPIQQIQGKITGGSININGDSNIRRTSNLNMLVEDRYSNIEDVNNLISLNKKIIIEVGFTNTTEEYKQYKKIWFPLGIFLIAGISVTNSAGGLNISLQLKDKMSLLNGDIGGVFPAATEISTKLNPVLIHNIIQQLVCHLGGQQMAKTIIDVPKEIKQVKAWYGSNDLYWCPAEAGIGSDSGSGVLDFCYLDYMRLDNCLYADGGILDSGHLDSMRLDEDLTLQPIDMDSSLYELYPYGGFYTTSEDIYNGVPNYSQKGSIYKTGQDLGYKLKGFTYPTRQDFIAGPGNALTTVLDQVKNQLGNYEYFYDIYGNFVFQEIKNYLNTSQASTLFSNNTMEELAANEYLIDRTSKKTVYEFTDGEIITSFTNNPNYSQIKNDFTVWGATSAGTSVRYHLVIDSKPKIPKEPYAVLKILDGPEEFEKASSGVLGYADEGCLILDSESACLSGWLEPDNYDTVTVPLKVATYNDLPIQGYPGIYYWVQDTELAYVWSDEDLAYVQPEISYKYIQDFHPTDWRTVLYINACMDRINGLYQQNSYYAQILYWWPRIYNVAKGKWKYDLKDPISRSKMPYYLDFLDTNAPISRYNVSAIGRRQKVIEDKEHINCVFETAIPDRILIYLNEKYGIKTFLQDYKSYLEDNKFTGFVDTRAFKQALHDIQYCKKNKYKFALVPYDVQRHISTGGRKNSAFELIKDLLYQYTNYNQNVTISAIPVFHLQPNTRIRITDKNSSIFGDFIIKSISLPLDINGTMTIQASRALEKF